MSPSLDTETIGASAVAHQTGTRPRDRLRMNDAETESTPLYITLRLPDRDAIRLLATVNRNKEYDFEIIAIVDPRNAESDSVMVDLTGLTKKQWEALEIAHSIGHYSGPRGGNLEIIAERLSISKSAASQRLRSAESRIIQAIFSPAKNLTARGEIGAANPDE